MAFLQRIRSPSLSFIQTVVSLFLGGTALMSSYWCVGQQKVPKPLCTATKHSNCIPVPGVSNSSNIQFFWETGDDRFVFPTFHTGLFITCEENIYTDAWGEKAVKLERFEMYFSTVQSAEKTSLITKRGPEPVMPRRKSPDVTLVTLKRI